MNHNLITQYYSKWQNQWVYFTDSFDNKYSPSLIEITQMQKYYYQLK